MAQKVHIQLVDDLDGSDASETVSFALDGGSYEIDLNEQHAGELREALAVYVGHARKVGTGRRSGSGSGSGGGRKSSSSNGAGSGPSAKEIRDWARENGWEVPDRGRVAAEVREAYDAAH